MPHSERPNPTPESDVYTDRNGDYQFASSTTETSTAGTENLQEALARMESWLTSPDGRASLKPELDVLNQPKRLLLSATVLATKR